MRWCLQFTHLCVGISPASGKIAVMISSITVQPYNTIIQYKSYNTFQFKMIHQNTIIQYNTVAFCITHNNLLKNFHICINSVYVLTIFCHLSTPPSPPSLLPFNPVQFIHLGKGPHCHQVGSHFSHSTGKGKRIGSFFSFFMKLRFWGVKGLFLISSLIFLDFFWQVEGFDWF